MSNWTRDLRQFDENGDVDHKTHVTDVWQFLTDVADPVHRKREATYKMSFAKRGLSSVWLNLARKYDRIDPLMAEVAASNYGSGGGLIPTLIDTLFDCAMYALKFIVILKKLYPDAYDNWFDNVNRG